MSTDQTPYTHRQSALLFTAIIAACALGGFVAVFSMAQSGAALGTTIAVTAGLTLLTVVIYGFSALTTSVDHACIKIAFRFGWPAREIPMDSIESHEEVRNRWWYGFGVRVVPGGWMYNVWGLGAVEVRYRTGGEPKTFRLGTDDPGGFAAAITSAREHHLGSQRTE